MTGKSGTFFKLVAGGVLAFGLGHAEAEVVTFLTPAADTTMRSTDPDLNYGASSTLFVGVSFSTPKTNRSLFQFNLASVPTNATVTSATLQIVVVGTGQPATNFDLCRMLKSWGEGVQDGLTNAVNESSWNARFAPSSLWGAGGGQAGLDFIAVPSCTAPLAGPVSTNAFSSAGMIADLQLWLSQPGTNFGWILLASGEPAGTGKQIGSRESGATNSPVLELHYTVPAAATPPNIFNAALSGNTMRFSFIAQSNRTYAVEFRASAASGIWNPTPLTNLPGLPSDTVVSITDTILTTGRYYRVRTPSP